MSEDSFRIAGLYRYPLKSAAGVRCESLELGRFGVRDDRRWMIIEPQGVPITQRELPALALLRASPSEDGLRVTWTGDDGGVANPRRPSRGAPRLPVRLWDDTVHLPVADDEANTWITGLLGREARFAYMPDDVERPVNPRYAAKRDRTSLTDGFPLHIIGSGSMEDLNARLSEPVGVERFRPNIYVEGTGPFDEDGWAEAMFGECRVRIVKPCPRCAVTTVDPATGRRGKEPLRTLSGYRKREGGVMFGQNALHDGSGTIRIGDPVRVLSRRDAPAA